MSIAKAAFNKLGDLVSSISKIPYMNFTEWISEVEEKIFETGINVKHRKYGAIGDGTSRPIYSNNPNSLSYQTFKTLVDLQKKYPLLTDSFLIENKIDIADTTTDATLTSWKVLELDWCAIQQAFLERKFVVIPEGKFRINKMLDGYGVRVQGKGRGQSQITQYVASEGVIALGSVPIVSDLAFRHYNTPLSVSPDPPEGSSFAVGVGINLHKYGLKDGAVLQRLLIENNVSGIFMGNSSSGHVYSATFKDIRITRFTHSGIFIGGVGHTGSLFENIYLVNWNNFDAQTKLTSTYGIYFRGMNEGIANQINIEHGYYNKGIVLSGANMELNSVHFEGYEPTGSFPTMFAIDGLATRATVRNVSLVYSKIDKAIVSDFSFATLGDNGVFEVDGFDERNNTVVGTPTLRKFFGAGTITEGAAIYSKKFRMLGNLFNSGDYFPNTPVQPYVREHNFDKYYWSEGGKRHFVKNSMPTTGNYNVDDIVHIPSPTEEGTAGSKYEVIQYRRLTTGSGHVLGTDWRERRVYTGN